MSDLIAYEHVSTVDQDLNSQFDALRKARAARIVTDKLSGWTTARPQLQTPLAHRNTGNVLASCSTDRSAA